jgi:hypothetical protein
MFGAFGQEDEQGAGRALTTTSTFYGTSDPSDWSSYPSGGGDSAYSPPPLVSATQPEGSSTSAKDWFGMGKDVVGTFVDIFGRPMQQQQPSAQPRPQQGVPVWAWALIGIGAVAALGLTIRAARPQRRYAGRRRSRR